MFLGTKIKCCDKCFCVSYQSGFKSRCSRIYSGILITFGMNNFFVLFFLKKKKKGVLEHKARRLQLKGRKKWTPGMWFSLLCQEIRIFKCLLVWRNKFFCNLLAGLTIHLCFCCIAKQADDSKG